MKKYLNLVLVVFVVSGCATKRVVDQNYVQSMNKIAIYVEENHNKPVRLDHADIAQETDAVVGASAAVGGLIGGLIGGAIAAGVSTSKMNNLTEESFGENFKTFQDLIGEYSIQNYLKSDLEYKFSEIMDVHLIHEKMSGQKLVKEAKENNATSLLVLKYNYGVAVFKDKHSSPAIDGFLSLKDVESKKTLIKKSVTSVNDYYDPHLSEWYFENGGENFKHSLGSAVGVFNKVVASNFGLFENEVKKVDYDIIPSLKMNCKRPFALTEDCAAVIGARRLIEIEGQKFKVAANADGSVILLMGQSGSFGMIKIREFHQFKNFISNQGFDFLRIQQIGNVTGYEEVVGYLLEFDQDVYSFLKSYTLEKQPNKMKEIKKIRGKGVFL